MSPTVHFLYRCALDAGFSRRAAGALTRTVLLLPDSDEWARFRSAFQHVVAHVSLTSQPEGGTNG